MKCILTLAQKKASWLWIAVDRLGHRFLNVIVGSRDTDTGQCLWEGLAHHDIGHIMTDYWQPYELFLPTELHTQSKAETHYISREANNTRLIPVLMSGACMYRF